MTTYASIFDMQAAARRKVPKPFYDYLENGSYTATTMQSNRDDLNAVKLRQRLLDTPSASTFETTVLGQKFAMPIALAPVGLAGANRGGGEAMAARAARDFGVPYILSNFSLAAIEDIAKAVGGHFWFQLYPMKDEKVNRSLIGRAKKAGCPVLVVTIDSQVEGTRYNDVHNGLGVPPKLTPGNLWAIATHPVWCLEMLRSPHFTFGNMLGESSTSGLDDLAKWVKGALRPTIDGEFLRWIRNQWDGKIVVKGILSTHDFRIARDAGADAVVVSNHGGRSLESGVSTVRALQAVMAEQHDKTEILVDSGIRTGIDILRFLGLGAKACLIGRAYVYAMAADGQRGVKTALEILQDDLRRTMAMTGVSDLNDLPADLIQYAPPSLETRPKRSAPREGALAAS